jgi:hypothetical protein
VSFFLQIDQRYQIPGIERRNPYLLYPNLLLKPGQLPVRSGLMSNSNGAFSVKVYDGIWVARSHLTQE